MTQSCLVLAAACAALALPGAAHAADFVVDPSGSDKGAGSTTRPFATLARALEAVRSLRRKPGTLSRPVVVEVRGGVYRLSAPVVFTPDDSGTAESPTVIRAASGGQPVFTGAALVSSWKEVASGLWEAPAPAGAGAATQLFARGERRMRPSWPHSGHLWIKDALAGTAKDRQDRFRPDLDGFPTHWTPRQWEGVEAVITHSWGITRSPIKSVDPKGESVTLAGSTWHASLAELKSGVWYRLDNAPIEAMRPGEWKVKPGGGALVYKPRPGETLKSFQAEVPVVEPLVEFRGSLDQGTLVGHIHLEGLAFEGSAWSLPPEGMSNYQAEVGVGAAIRAVNGRNLAFRRVTVRRVGGYALDMGEGCRDVEISGCQLYDLGAGGIRVGGINFNGEEDQRRYADSIKITGCTIAHGGRLHPAGIGVWIAHAAHNVVADNLIYDFYYSGISVGWRWGDGFSPARHNLVTGNHIHTIGQGVLSDMAGVYTLGVSPGTVVARNLIHDVRRARYGGWGIYFDEGSAHIVVEDNVAYRTEDAPFHIHYGRDNEVRHNVFAYGELAQMQFSNMAKTGRIVLSDNLFRWQKGPLFSSQPDDEIEFRRNTYWREEDPQGILFAQGLAWDAWKAKEPGASIRDLPFDPAKGWRPSSDPGAPGPRVAPAASAPRQPLRLSSPVPRTFPAAPKERPVVVDQGFEGLSMGQRMPGWNLLSPDASKVEVTNETAAAGKHSLKFIDSGQGEPWMPHLFLNLNYPSGEVRSSFWLRVEKGAQPSFEWRDINPWYTSGPGFRVDAEGRLLAGSRSVALPAGAWVKVEIAAVIGGRREWSLALSGGGLSEKWTLPMPEGFKTLGWVGFTSDGGGPSVFYVDEVYIGPRRG